MEDEVYYFSSIKQGNLDPKVKFRFHFKLCEQVQGGPMYL